MAAPSSANIRAWTLTGLPARTSSPMCNPSRGRLVEETMRRLTRCLFLFCALLLVGGPTGAHADELLVSAAASLTDAMNALAEAFRKTNPQTTLRFNFASSGALQQQIAQGAPVDVFASASPKEMDALQQAGRIDPETRIDFAGNRLVLI